MNEATFLKKYKTKWQTFEKVLRGNEDKDLKPDEIADLYIELTDDLSYARTFYPESKTVQYLNNLSLEAHRKIFTYKKLDAERPMQFFITELPLLLKKNRKYIFISLLVFMVSTAIGAVSAANDAEFIRLILGDSYVNTTLENIKKGDPMAIYKSENNLDMFFGITINNIKVSFYVFVSGIFSAFATMYLLFQNGVMLGAFQYFFYEKNLMNVSASAIYLHGTLELSAIVIAGAAGILLGNGFLFPGTYNRRYALKQSAKESMKIIAGLIPVFIAAGFIEGFITRYYKDMPSIFNYLIIIVSATFVLFYYFIYPEKVYKKYANATSK